MAYYTVYWPQDWLDELRKSNDTGPIKSSVWQHPRKPDSAHQSTHHFRKEGDGRTRHLPDLHYIA